MNCVRFDVGCSGLTIVSMSYVSGTNKLMSERSVHCLPTVSNGAFEFSNLIGQNVFIHYFLFIYLLPDYFVVAVIIMT